MCGDGMRGDGMCGDGMCGDGMCGDAKADGRLVILAVTGELHGSRLNLKRFTGCNGW